MNFYDITVQTDTRFDADENGDRVLEGRLGGRRILGWWTRAEFDRWLKARCGRICEERDDAMIVVAQLTKKEAR